MAVITASNREIAFLIFYLLHFKSAAETVLYIEISITRTGKKRKRKTKNRSKICQIGPMVAQKKEAGSRRKNILRQELCTSGNPEKTMLC